MKQFGTLQESGKELSILLPVYNEVCVDKVEELKRLCDLIPSLRYEIIVADDGSTDKETIETNSRIGKLTNCMFAVKPDNSGSGATRNYLASIAHYQWLLFLDCDMAIPDDKFITRYLDACESCGDAVINGGIAIQKREELETVNLRYMYESAEEHKHTAAQRAKRPYQSFRSTNFLISRKLILKYPFDERMKRYEDVFFGRVLKENHVKMMHIDNPTVLYNFESNADYIAKVEKSLDVLFEFQKELRGYSPLLTFVKWLEHVFPLSLLRVWHRSFGKAERHNLTGSKPNLRVFRLYQLGYFLSLR